MYLYNGVSYETLDGVLDQITKEGRRCAGFFNPEKLKKYEEKYASEEPSLAEKFGIDWQKNHAAAAAAYLKGG